MSENITSDGTPKLNQEEKAKNHRKLKDKILTILEHIIWKTVADLFCLLCYYQRFSFLDKSLLFGRSENVCVYIHCLPILKLNLNSCKF